MQYSYKARLANPVIILVMMAVAGAGNAFEQVKSDRGLREELGLAPDAEVQLIRVTLEKIHDKALAEKLLTGCVERIKDGREWSVEVIGLFDIDYDSRNWHLDQPDEIRELLLLRYIPADITTAIESAINDVDSDCRSLLIVLLGLRGVRSASAESLLNQIGYKSADYNDRVCAAFAIRSIAGTSKGARQLCFQLLRELIASNAARRGVDLEPPRFELDTALLIPSDSIGNLIDKVVHLCGSYSDFAVDETSSILDAFDSTHEFCFDFRVVHNIDKNMQYSTRYLMKGLQSQDTFLIGGQFPVFWSTSRSALMALPKFDRVDDRIIDMVARRLITALLEHRYPIGDEDEVFLLSACFLRAVECSANSSNHLSSDTLVASTLEVINNDLHDKELPEDHFVELVSKILFARAADEQQSKLARDDLAIALKDRLSILDTYRARLVLCLLNRAGLCEYAEPITIESVFGEGVDTYPFVSVDPELFEYERLNCLFRARFKAEPDVAIDLLAAHPNILGASMKGMDLDLLLEYLKRKSPEKRRDFLQLVSTWRIRNYCQRIETIQTSFPFGLSVLDMVLIDRGFPDDLSSDWQTVLAHFTKETFQECVESANLPMTKDFVNTLERLVLIPASVPVPSKVVRAIYMAIDGEHDAAQLAGLIAATRFRLRPTSATLTRCAKSANILVIRELIRLLRSQPAIDSNDELVAELRQNENSYVRGLLDTSKSGNEDLHILGLETRFVSW